MYWRQICLGAVLCATLIRPAARAGVLDGDGIGAYGDSMTMQYSQWVPVAALYGLNIHSDGTQFNWVDHLALSGYNMGPETTLLGFPYNAYNVAVAGTSSSSLLTLANHVTDYLASGDIRTVVINSGGNDFGNGPYYDDFYNRTANPSYHPLNDPDAAEVINEVITNLSDVIDFTLATNPNTRFVLHTVPDLGVTPDYIADHPDPARRALVSEVFDELNAQIVALAEQHNAPVVDLNSLASLLDVGGSVAGIPILYSGGTTGNHAFLSDGFHPGTIMQGFMANAVLLAHHIAWGDQIELISDQTIVTRAGLTPLNPGPTYQDLSQFIIFSVPEPGTIVLAAMGGVALLITARRRQKVVVRLPKNVGLRCH